MYTILIVDDEANLLEVLAVALENMGYGTVTAETAEEALAVLEEREVHLVLSDLRLPGLSGRELMEKVKFTVIRGNISEIKTLALGSGTTKGVDADVADAVTDANLDSAVKFVKDFAAKSGAIVAVTGAIDLVSDGTACYVIRNGRPEMGKITGTGCQLSGMMTAFVVANPDNKLEAAAAAVCAMGLAGEIGWSRMAEGDGNSTYRNRIIDAIYNMDGATLNGGAKYELR